MVRHAVDGLRLSLWSTGKLVWSRSWANQPTPLAYRRAPTGVENERHRLEPRMRVRLPYGLAGTKIQPVVHQQHERGSSRQAHPHARPRLRYAQALRSQGRAHWRALCGRCAASRASDRTLCSSRSLHSGPRGDAPASGSKRADLRPRLRECLRPGRGAQRNALGPDDGDIAQADEAQRRDQVGLVMLHRGSRCSCVHDQVPCPAYFARSRNACRIAISTGE
jgi:hypothetical protein